MARLARSLLLCLALLPLWATALDASDPPGIAGSAAVLFEYNARRVLTETRPTRGDRRPA
jgi:hypothetical protein